MEYPYIANNNLMFYAKDTATFVGDEDNLNTHGFKIAANESKFTNITREYLEGKCVKIESPEHGELVQKLAFNAGFKWREYSDNIRSVASGDFINLRSNGLITYGCRAILNKQITIPLPPKAEPKGFPQVGDTVSLRYKFDSKQVMHTGELLYLSDNHIVIKTASANDHHCHRCDWSIEKPKTEAEILRDELIDMAFNQLNDDSHPLDRNACYLVSDLIHKYNITKKV